MDTITTLLQQTGQLIQHPYAVAGASAGLAFASLLVVARVLRALIAKGRSQSETTIDDLLTWLVAAIATAVSAEGSYRVFHDVLQFDPWLLWPTFAVVELIMLVSAIRARRHMRQFGASGIDGIAVWAFAGITATLASVHALSQGHLVETIVRALAPFMAAYLWERGMRLARAIRKGRKSINWTFGLERILVRLGLAEPAERDTTEVSAHRYLTELAKKTAALRRLETSPAGTERRVNRATKHQARAMTKVLEHTDFATSKPRQEQFMAIYGALVNAASLTKVTPAEFWKQQEKAQTPYPPIVIQESVVQPETVVIETAPPVPVLAAVNGNGHKSTPKPAPKATPKPRNSNARLAAYEIWLDQKNVSPKTVAEKTGANYKSVARWLGEFRKGQVPN